MENDKLIDTHNYYPLTHPQKRIWYIEKYYPNTPLHNIGGPAKVKGIVNFALLERSINIFIQKNEGIRLQLAEQAGDVKQYVNEHKYEKLDFFDFRSFENSEKAFTEWGKAVIEEPFDLYNNKLFYFALFQIDEEFTGYFVKFHHIVADGWTINLMAEQICDSYEKLVQGAEINIEPKNSYLNYIKLEKRYLTSEKFLKNKVFWNEKYKELPDYFLSSSSQNIRGKRERYYLNEEKSNQIKQFVKENKGSVNTFFVTVFLVYLCLTTQNKDIIIGTPVLNRKGAAEKNMVGMFTSTMPFRYKIDINDHGLNLFKGINSELLTCYFNQKYPYDLLVKDLELKQRGYERLFDVCVNYYNTKPSTTLDNLSIVNEEFYNGNQIYSLQMMIKDWSDSGVLSLEYDYKIFDYTDKEIDYLNHHLKQIIDQILLDPTEKLCRYNLLSVEEKGRLITDFNHTRSTYPLSKTIHQLFEDQVEKTPDYIAVTDDHHSLTYRELNGKANQLARLLRTKNVGDNVIVGLLTVHSTETIVGIFAVLKAGGAYLPIDPGYPVERINYIIEDSNIGIILTNEGVDRNFAFRGEIINISNQDLYVGDTANLELKYNSNNLVYLIYTSGSTGRPKGIMIEHQSLVNYIWWAIQMYLASSQREVFPLYSSLAFDLTVTSIYTPLLSGNKIIVYQANDAEFVLHQIVRDNKATIIKLTPSHLALLKDMKFEKSSVKRLIVGGEELKVSLAKHISENFADSIEIYNEYGPTETVVGCMIHKFNPVSDLRVTVPIGKPIHNVQVYILDENLNPVAVNMIGELYVSGDGVGRGYINRPELTRERFIANPFIKEKQMYRTGDLAKFRGDGKIEYIGRVDQQVKIRGYRIELGEIENYLLDYDPIQEAVVLALDHQNKSKFLCAYIVSGTKITNMELDKYLRKFLPTYMIPQYYCYLDQIPLTANGKINKQLLPDPVIESLDSEFIAYRTEFEGNLVKAVSEILNIETVSVKANFYQLGGDSIKAIQIAAKLNEKNLKLNVKDILEHPVIEEMAGYIEEKEKIIQEEEFCQGIIPGMPIFDWFFSQNLTNPHLYNQSIFLELKVDLSVDMLNIIFDHLVRHHDSLRINYCLQKKELYYNQKYLENPNTIWEYDLSKSSEPFIQMRELSNILKNSFNLEDGILIKGGLFKLKDEHKVLFITAHHLVIDGISWNIILNDIVLMLKQITADEKVKLPEKTNSLKQWANFLATQRISEVLSETDYWHDVLLKKQKFLLDYEENESVGQIKTLTRDMVLKGGNYTMTKANYAYNTETQELLIASLILSLIEFTGSKEIIIELEGHGREGELDLSRTVGWFTCMYPVYFKIERTDLPSVIREVKEQFRSIPNNGIGFGILKYLSQTLVNNNEKYIRFNYLGDFSSGFDNEFFRLSTPDLVVDTDVNNRLSALMDCNCFIINQRLHFAMTYESQQFSSGTIERLINLYIENLQTILEHCCQRDEVAFSPSDFSAAISQKELDSLFED